MAAHKEGKIEAYFVEQVEAHGGITRKARWLCRRGCPDRFWAFRGTQGRGSSNGLAEIKPPGQPLKPHQWRETNRLSEMGVEVVVIDSFEAVDLFVKRHA